VDVIIPDKLSGLFDYLAPSVNTPSGHMEVRPGNGILEFHLIIEDNDVFGIERSANLINI
jgi:hypothetical protein